jgi:hypothetical protein
MGLRSIRSAVLRILRSGTVAREGTQVFPRSEGDGDTVRVVPPFESAQEDTDRWNEEWLRYLAREWPAQLRRHSEISGKPPLPDNPIEMIDFRIDDSPRMALFCHREDLEGRFVMEMGCGCGNLGKVLGRYVEHYLGVDYSTLALRVATLVSPDNCSYKHVADRDSLTPFFGAIDTVVSRFFWIHQNRELARYNLEYLLNFLKPGGRAYLDFYWPNSQVRQGIVFSPEHALSKQYPSATFKYSREDVDGLLGGLPLRRLSEEINLRMQRRYVVLERDDVHGD